MFQNQFQIAIIPTHANGQKHAQKIVSYMI